MNYIIEEAFFQTYVSFAQNAICQIRRAILRQKEKLNLLKILLKILKRKKQRKSYIEFRVKHLTASGGKFFFRQLEKCFLRIVSEEKGINFYIFFILHLIQI